MYVTGAASPEETVQVIAWRNEYPGVAAEISRLEEVLEVYALAHAIEPSASLKNEILSGLDFPEKAVNPGSAKVVSLFPWRMAAAASILLLIGSTVLNIFYYNKYTETDKKYLHGEEQLALLNNRVGSMDSDMNIVRSRYSEPVALHGMEAAPDAGAKIFWMKNTGEVFVDPGNLPMAPHGKQYQLWAIVDGKPVDGGMISANDGKKYSIQKMKTFGKAQAFAITLETEGGNPEPKGVMYVKGEI